MEKEFLSISSTNLQALLKDDQLGVNSELTVIHAAIRYGQEIIDVYGIFFILKGETNKNNNCLIMDTVVILFICRIEKKIS